MARGRKATGSVLFLNGQWHVRVTAPDGSRPYIPIAGVAEGDYERAKVVGTTVAKKYRSQGQVDTVTSETVSEWFEKWFVHRENSGLKWGSKDRSKFVTHIEPYIGTLAIAAVSRSDIERLVARWDAKIASSEAGWKNLGNAWGLVTKMFIDARRSKNTTLRRRDDNPCEDVEGPNRGAKKSKAFLYPDELLKLVNSDAVPLRWKRLIVLAVYLYVRRGELAALRRSDVDLEHGTVHVHSAEGEDGEVGEIKTATQVKSGCVTRRVPIEPTLIPLLATMCVGLHDNDPLVEMPHESMMSGEDYGLRRWLKAAGIKRADLFADRRDRTRKNITWHDLRATGITWRAVREDAPLVIMEAAGHTNFQTTQLYVRTAVGLKRGFGVPFPELPTGLLTGAVEYRPKNVYRQISHLVSGGNHLDKKRPQRESNPTGDRDIIHVSGNIVQNTPMLARSKDDACYATDSIAEDEYVSQLMTMIGHPSK